MTILLGIDFETTGLDATKDKIIEVGMVLWHTENKQIIDCQSVLVDPSVDGEYQELSEEVVKLTGITNQMLFEHGIPLEAALRLIEQWAVKSHYFVAHNAPFEQGFLSQYPLSDHAKSMPWVDTIVDIEGLEGLSLEVLAARHGLINLFPHRALTDVLVMLKVLSMHPFHLVEKSALSPSVMVVCEFPYEKDESRRVLIKAMGFRWHGETKSWRKSVKELRVTEEIEALEVQGFTPQIYARNGT